MKPLGATSSLEIIENDQGSRVCSRPGQDSGLASAEVPEPDRAVNLQSGHNGEELGLLKSFRRDVVWPLLKDLFRDGLWDYERAVEDTKEVEKFGAREKDDR